MANNDEYQQVLDLEPVMRSWAVRFAGRRQLTDDLLQETFLRTWQGWHSFRQGSDLRGWCYTVMRNVWIDWQRRPGTDLVSAAGDAWDLDERSAPTVPYYQEINPVSLVAEAAESVPPAFLQVLLALDVYGESRAAIAQRLGIAEGTVSSRAHRARAILRVRLADLIAQHLETEHPPPDAEGVPVTIG